jgi:hypothetical protein
LTLGCLLTAHAQCIARRYLFRSLALVLAGTSVILVLAEVTIWLQLLPGKAGDNVSVISLIVDSNNASDFGTMLLVGLVLFYMLTCTYFTVLKLAMFKFFHVVPGYTDAVSLTISATLFSRYASPLCLNFLTMLPKIHEELKEFNFETALGIHTRKGDPRVLPTAAIDFIQIFPVVLAVFCPVVAFGQLDRLKGYFSKSRFSISEEGIADETTAKGRAILEKEKESIRGGTKPGETHSAFAKRPPRAARALAAESGGRFFGRKKESGPEQQRLLASDAAEQRPPSRGDRGSTRADEIRAKLATRSWGDSAAAAKEAAAKPAPAAREAAAKPAAAREAAAKPAAELKRALEPPAKPPKPDANPGTSKNSLDSFFASLG